MVMHDNSLYVLDVAVCHVDRMNRTYQLKIDKYGSAQYDPSIRRFAIQRFSNFSQIYHCPIVINNRGFLHPSSQKSLRRLQLTKLEIQLNVTLMNSTPFVILSFPFPLFDAT